VTLPEGVPAFEGGYDAADFLSAEALERFRALAARQQVDGQSNGQVAA
jgi:hypothetical protein